MKIRALILFGLLGFSISGWACDACGCGLAPIYWGILPQSDAHYLGIWYNHQAFRSQLDPGFDALALGSSEEYFNTVEWRARLVLPKGFALSAVVPMSWHRRIGAGGQREDLQGIGDIWLVVRKDLFNSADSMMNLVRHRLKVGGGIKLPTGTFRNLNDSQLYNPNFQLGTGSWDYLLTVSYTARLDNLGASVDLNYRYNTTNPEEYRFGNTLSGSVTAFRRFQAGLWEVMPNAGIQYDWSNENVDRDFIQSRTGGYAWQGGGGVEIYRSRWNLGINYFHPFVQYWFAGQVTSHGRMSVHLQIFI